MSSLGFLLLLLVTQTKQKKTQIKLAVKVKLAKYSEIKSGGVHLTVFEVENKGVRYKEGEELIIEIGKRLIGMTGNKKNYLIQKLIMTIQRGNVASVLCKYPMARPSKKYFSCYNL